MKPTPLQYQSSDRPWSFPFLMKAVEPFLPALDDKTRVLDIGCGNGYWAGVLAQRGCTVVGIDASETGIANARKAHPGLRFENRAISENLGEALAEEPFDMVLSLEVVEHLYAPRDWAVACYRALRPGGVLICSTPHHGFLKNMALSLTNKWDAHLAPCFEGGHIKFWSRKTLTKLLCDAGFSAENLRFRGAGRVPGLWMSMVLCVIK